MRIRRGAITTLRLGRGPTSASTKGEAVAVAPDGATATDGNKPKRSASRERSEPRGSRPRILEVATREFAQKGFAGARVEEIARGAGVSKQALYYYFKNKEALYDAVLANIVDASRSASDRLQERMQREGYLDAVLHGATLAERKQGQLWRRLWAWEALERGHQNIITEDERREGWQRWIQLIVEAQKRGEIDDSVDPEMLVLALEAIINYPGILPQNTKLITGSPPMDEQFVERHIVFLRWFFERLRPEA
jgi:AcrR family transcriptional regulator